MVFQFPLLCPEGLTILTNWWIFLRDVAVLSSIRTTVMAMVNGKKSLLFQVWLLERRGGWWCPFRINEYLDSRALPGGRSSNHRPAKTICTAIVKVGLTDGEWVMLISLGSCNHSNPNLNPCNCPHYNCGQVSVRSSIWGAGGGVHVYMCSWWCVVMWDRCSESINI